MHEFQANIAIPVPNLVQVSLVGPTAGVCLHLPTPPVRTISVRRLFRTDSL
jgi:hypothetical protein